MSIQTDVLTIAGAHKKFGEVVALDGAALQRQAAYWQATLADHKEGYFISGAPLVVRDLVVIGVSMIPRGRGFIAAYEASTGKQGALALLHHPGAGRTRS